MLDHCARECVTRSKGIKALILYPMTPGIGQAGRIAEIASETRLAGLTAGLYVGEAGRHSSMGADHLIDKRKPSVRTRPTSC